MKKDNKLKQDYIKYLINCSNHFYNIGDYKTCDLIMKQIKEEQIKK